MVNIIIENILSTSGNRALYETLWNLSITKSFKPGNAKNRNAYENESIAEICNELIKDIKRDYPDRTKFYFSTQLVFGTLLLYRFQIDRLYNQTKLSLQSCKSQFFDINWLTDMTRNESQTQQPSSKKITKQKGKHGKANLPLEMDLLEQFFQIPEMPTRPIHNKGSGKQTEADEIDPTMIINVNEITLIDNIHPADNTSAIEDEIEFGEIEKTLDFDFSFHATHQNPPEPIQGQSAVVEDLGEEVPDMTRSPDNLRKASSPTPVVDLPNVSFTNDIMEIIKQKPTRKRRSSDLHDISLRLGPVYKEPRLDDEENVIDMSANQHNVIPSFDANANDVEITRAPVAVAETPEIPNTFTIPEPNDLDFIDLALMPPTSPLQQHQKASARKQNQKSKLVVDKQTKIKGDVLKSNLENYQMKFTFQSPIDSFSSRMHQLKSANGVLFLSPASRLNRCARQLLPIYERNLKKVPMKLPKRPLEESEERPQSPAKKRRMERKESTLAVPEIEAMPEILEFDAPQVPEIEVPLETLLPYQPVELDELERIPLMELSPNAIPKQAAKKRVKSRQNVTENIGEYQEDEKWSKDKIMSTLTTFWSKNVDSITMGKLSAKTNRFVAAGIFFELMVLSKIGAVELTQDSAFGIANITPGHCVNQYI